MTRDDTHPACALCENDINPDTGRESREGETVHTYCARMADAKDRYHFSIINPASDPRVSFGFYYLTPDGSREYPILSNTGGLTVYFSAEAAFGEQSLPVKSAFIEAFGLGWHWLMCYRPLTVDAIAEQFEHIAGDYYDGTMGDHERWALFRLLTHALMSDDPLPHEWKPLIDFADACTKMGVPDVADAGPEAEP